MIKKLFTNPTFNLIATMLMILVIGICIGVVGHARFGPQPTVKILPSNTRTVYLPKTEIQTKDVIKYVTDKKEVTKLMAENKTLGQTVTNLNEMIAKYNADAQGPVNTVPSNTVDLPPTNTTAPTVTEFKDWRLHFVSNGEQGRYQLTQQFEVLSTMAKDKEGKPVTTVRLFEIGANGERLPITDAKTTSVVTIPTNHFYLGLNVQGGIAVTYKDGEALKGAIIGAQWLKRGKTHAPADTRYAFATPVVFLGNDITEFGILPVSYNLGTLPYQPFTNVWLSPYVGVNMTGNVSRIGIVVSATF